MAANEFETLQVSSGQEAAPAQPPSTPDDLIDISKEIGEKPETILRRRDLPQVLELMRRGLVVKLTIEAPSFTARLDNEHLGLEYDEQAARSVLNEYFRLGTIILLPKELYRELRVEIAKARKSLYRYAIKSRQFGLFLPVQNYQAWKQQNEYHQQVFEELKQRIITEWPALVEQVIEIYRPMATNAWRQFYWRTGAKLRETYPQPEEFEARLAEIRATQERFIEYYLARIRAAMPGDGESLADEFIYEWTLERVSLPSELARDKEVADRLYKEQALADAEHQAQLEQIRVANRAEQERVRLQAEMERDLMRSTRQQAQQMADEFFSEIIGRVNQSIEDVCANVLESLDKNEGKLVGRASLQLHNLMEELKGYSSYLEDDKLAEQVRRIQAAIPQRPTTAGGSPIKKIKLDTSPLKRVLTEVGREAKAVLIELEEQPATRLANFRRRTATGDEGGGEIDSGALEKEVLGLDLNQPAGAGSRRAARNLLPNSGEGSLSITGGNTLKGPGRRKGTGGRIEL